MKGPWIARLSPALIALLVGFAAFGGQHASAEHHASVSRTAQASATITTSTPATADEHGPVTSEGADVDDDISDVIPGELNDTPLRELSVNHLFENHEWPCTHAHWPSLSARGPPAV